MPAEPGSSVSAHGGSCASHESLDACTKRMTVPGQVAGAIFDRLA
jgi:cystathionine beta-lyase family protein involved in aluminum resistance